MNDDFRDLLYIQDFSLFEQDTRNEELQTNFTLHPPIESIDRCRLLSGQKSEAFLAKNTLLGILVIRGEPRRMRTLRGLALSIRHLESVHTLSWNRMRER